MADLRILITGGGTGGHAAPAIATARAIREECDRRGLAPIFRYVGSRHGVEERLAREAGLDFVGVETGKVRRARKLSGYVSWANFTDALRVPVGVFQALGEVARFRPDVVLATGGYVSIPTVVAAWALRRPIVAHEQTVQIGLANRVIARLTTRMAVSFPESISELPKGLHKKCVVTGNPVRAVVLAGDRDRAKERFGFDKTLECEPTVYVTGGAQGARLINRAVQEELPAILALARVVHQSGEQDYDTLTASAEQLSDKLRSRYHVTRFVGEEIGDVYALADLVVGRSGAGTVTEVCVLGKPALFIPLVPTGGDEQTRNARRLADIGAAQVISQDELTGKRLLTEIGALLGDREALARMGESAKSLSRPNAAEDLAKLVIDLGIVRKGRAGDPKE